MRKNTSPIRVRVQFRGTGREKRLAENRPPRDWGGQGMKAKTSQFPSHETTTGRRRVRRVIFPDGQRRKRKRIRVRVRVRVRVPSQEDIFLSFFFMVVLFVCLFVCLLLGVKAAPTATTTLGVGIVDDCKTAPNQLLLEVNRRAAQKLERHAVHHHNRAIAVDDDVAVLCVVRRLPLELVLVAGTTTRLHAHAKASLRAIFLRKLPDASHARVAQLDRMHPVCPC